MVDGGDDYWYCRGVAVVMEESQIIDTIIFALASESVLCLHL
ncbi:hypothetical protein [Sinobaca sp. H24]|nr:hypothetical protein [Sinobaca sp. H24]